MSAPSLEMILERYVTRIQQQMQARCPTAAQLLKQSSHTVLSGGRSGRVYHGYTASAPGEPPAARTGAYRGSWQPVIQTGGDNFSVQFSSGLSVSGYPLGAILEYGTSKMAPRPHRKKILEQAKPHVIQLYQKPYLQ